MRTLRNIGVASTAMAALLSATLVFAEDKPASARAAMEDKRGEVRAIRQEIKDIREEAKKDIKDVREDARNKVEEKRDQMKKRLADIKDTAKQKEAARIADQLESINKNWTDHFVNVLDHLDTILKKVESRSEKARAGGQNATSTDSAVTVAKTAIADARTAVSLQAAKTYVVDVSTISTTTATSTAKGQGELMKGLRAAYKNLHKQLFQDLYALRDGVMKTARTAVQNAVQTLRAYKVEDGRATSTESNQNN